MFESRSLDLPLVKRPEFWFGLVVLTALISYACTIDHGFVFDDVTDVVDNQLIRTLRNAGLIFSTSARTPSGIESVLYRPVTTLSYMLDHAIAGPNPAIYHLANIVMHAGVSLLVMLLATSLGLSVVGSGVAAVLFAVHPVQVEVVANIAGRKEALMTGFLLAGLVVRYAGLNKGGGRPLAGAFLYLLAMLSKETGVVGLPLLVLWDRYRGAESDETVDRRRFQSYWLWAGALVVYLALRWHAVGVMAPSDIPFLDNPAAHAAAAQRLLTAVAVLAKGWLLLLAPVSLSPDYSFNAIPLVSAIWDPRFLVAVGILAAMVAAATRFRHTIPILAFALVWHILTILPASNILVPIGTVFGDRFLYLPSVGLCLVTGTLISRTPSRMRRLTAAFALVVVIGLGVRTVVYGATWKDRLTLFEAAVRVVPQSAKVRYNLGTYYAEAGRLVDAEKEFRVAVEIYPEFSNSHNQLGNVYLLTGRPNLARAEYEQAVLYEDRNAEAHYNLGRRLEADGEPTRAVHHFRRFLELASGAFPAQEMYARDRLRRLENGVDR